NLDYIDNTADISGDPEFSTPGIWSEGVVASSIHNAIIPSDTGSIFINDGYDATVGNLSVDNAFYIQDGSLTIIGSAEFPTQGYIEVDGGSLIVNGLIDDDVGQLFLKDGTLDGSGSITLPRIFFGAGSAPGDVFTVQNIDLTISDVASHSSLVQGTGVKVIDAASITVDGDLRIESGQENFSLDNGASITIASGGLLVLADEDGINAGTGSGTLTVLMGGTLERSTSSGDTAIDVPVDLNGAVNVQTGRLELTAGGNLSGAVTLSNSAHFELSGLNVFTVNDALAISGAGTTTLDNVDLEIDADFSIAGGHTLDIAAGTTVTVASGVTISNDGIITGEGTLDFSAGGTFVNNGIIDPSGELTVTGDIDLATSGGMTFDITDAMTFDALSADSLDLDGASNVLNLNFGAGIAAGESFDIITYNDVDGDLSDVFETVNVTGLTANQYVELSYSANGVTVTVLQPPELLGTTGAVNSLQFDGVDDVVKITDPSAFMTAAGAFTYEAWFKTSASGKHQQILGVGVQSTGIGIDFYIDPTGKLSAGPNNVLGLTTADPVNDGAWHHAAFTHDGSGNYTLYLDGVEANAANSTAPNITTGSFNIGMSTSNTNPFEGEIADVRAWSVERSATEIAENYLHVLETPESVSENPGLEGYWRFDAINSDGTATDLTLNGNDAQVVSPAPPVNAALDFDGDTTQDFVQIASGVPAMSKITIEAWINPDDITGQHAVFASGPDSVATTLFSIENGRPAFYTNSSGWRYADETLSIGEWRHIAVTFDPATDELDFYIDGVADSVGTQTLTETLTMDSSAAIGNQSSTSTAAVNPFDGQIAEVRLWDAVRTQSEINSYKDSPLSAGEASNGLVGYWPLDDGSGTTAAAVIGTDGTVQDGSSAHGTPPWVTVEHPTPLLLGQNMRTAIEFEGGDFVTTSLTDVPEDFTIEAWFQTGDDPSDGDYKPILSKQTGGSNFTSEFDLQINNLGQLSFFMGNGSTYGVQIEDNTELNANSWYHTSVSVNGTTGEVTIYLNGEVIGSDVFSGTRQDGANALEIGRFANGATQTYLGAIADVRVWDGVRSADEVAGSMVGFVASDSPGLLANWRLDDLASGVASSAADATGNADGTVTGGPSFVTNDIPLASLLISNSEDSVLQGRLLAADDDPDTVIFSVEPEGAPENGTLVLNADGTYRYTPSANYSGSDSFTVRATDSAGAFATQTINVAINAVDDAPTILGASDAQTFVQLDGQDDYLQVNDDFTIDVGTDDFTLEAWIDLASLPTSGQTMKLFDKRDANNHGMVVFIDEDGYLKMTLYEGMQSQTFTSSGTVDTEGWYHVAVAVDRDGSADFYIDGSYAGGGD
ncbi:MAG: LamG-like jellyroll fold domain-containing protein, partial [Rhodospirillales bacterium]